ncbi:MAG: RNA pseudouridine synthase [Treponema sp.]|nr:RNA pseudouridine synthase [Treponema sp.]
MSLLCLKQKLLKDLRKFLPYFTKNTVKLFYQTEICGRSAEMENIRIIAEPSEKNPFAVIYKPRGLASAPLAEGDDSAFTRAAGIFPELKDVHGIKAVEGGLVHRIDTVTDGILVIASTQQSYDSFILQQKEGQFIKEYTALCRYQKNLPEGFPPCTADREKISACMQSRSFFKLSSLFRPFGKKGSAVRPVRTDGVSGRAEQKKAGTKIYTTEILLEKGTDHDVFKATCRITAGYRHQVRCHLCWCGFPVTGDRVYSLSGIEEDFSFTASSLSFLHPVSSERISFSV